MSAKLPSGVFEPVTMARRHWLCVTALCALACANEVDQTVDPPPHEGMRTMILVTEEAPGQPTVQVVSLDGPGWRLVAPLAPADATNYYALLYGCPLEALGLFEGPVPLGGTRPLPRHAAAYRGRLVPGEPLQWEALSETPGLVTNVLIDVPPPDLCARLDVTTVVLEQASTIHSLVALDAETALVGDEYGPVYTVNKDGDVRALPYAPVRQAVRAAFRRGDGEIRFSLDDGCLAQGDGASMPESVVCLGSPRRHKWVDMAGAPANAPLEIFLASQDGTFERFDGNDLQTVFALFDPMADTGTNMSVLWLEPGKAMAVGLQPQVVHVYEQGRVIRENYPLDFVDVDQGLALGHSPVLGVFLGTEFGDLLQRRNGTWVPFGAPTRVPNRVLLPLDDGLLFGGGAGTFTEMRVDGTFCPPITLAMDEVRRGVVAGPRSYIFVSRRSSTHAIVIFAERTDERTLCFERP